MKWQENFEKIKKYIIENKEKLDNKPIGIFLGIIGYELKISPATIRVSYLGSLVATNVIEVNEDNIVKIKG